MAVIGPLALLLALDKALKLSASNTALFAVLHGNIRSALWQNLLEPSIRSSLSMLLGCVLLVGLLLSRLAARRGRSWIGWVCAIPLVYAATILGGWLHQDANPLWSFTMSQAAFDLRRGVALWWRDAITLILLVSLMAWHLTRTARRRSMIRAAVVWMIFALALILTALDAGFFVATGTSLGADDLSYGLMSPSAGWLLATESLSTPVIHTIIAILLFALTSIAIGLFLARRSVHATVRGHHESSAVLLGLALWPALACAVASPAGPHNHWGSTSADDPLLSFTLDGLEHDVLRAVVLHSGGSPSSLVPSLNIGQMNVARTPRTRPLNVVIIMLESARARDTTVYSPEIGTTPFLARLAQESLIVDAMYAVVPRTSAAWIAILAGRYPGPGAFTHNLARERALSFQSSLPRILRTQGYRSAFFLPTTLQFEDDDAVVRGLDFDEVVSKESIPEPASGLITPFGWEDRALLAPIGRWLDGRVSDHRPFLLAVMTNVGHNPYRLPPGYRMERYPSLNEMHERYLNCLRYIDGYVRDVVAELRDRGLLENTLLVVLGDHGESFGEHGSFVRERGLHDEVLRVPMLIRLPAGDGRVGHIGGLRQQVDVLPTVIDALALAPGGAALPGRSMLSDAHGHEALFFSQHLDYADLAMRVGSRKYVYDFDRDPLEVFDLERDPRERRNLRNEIGLRDAMQAEIDLLAWRSRVGETFGVSHGPGSAARLNGNGEYRAR